MSSSGETIAETLRVATHLLSSAGVDTPRLDAEVLIRHALGLSRTELFAALRDPLPATRRADIDRRIRDRAWGVPVAYLTGAREFFGRDFQVGPGVLIPRPETELLVEWGLTRLDAMTASTILDVGTGSGAIALSIAAETGRRTLGIDLSAAALGYAARNRSTLGLVDRVDLVQSDLTAAIRGPVDLVLANLPYLRPDQLASNPGLRAEPETALVSGHDGLDAIDRLIADLPRLLAKSGSAGLELDPSQAKAVAAHLAAALPGHDIAIAADLAQADRFVFAVPR